MLTITYGVLKKRKKITNNKITLKNKDVMLMLTRHVLLRYLFFIYIYIYIKIYLYINVYI